MAECILCGYSCDGSLMRMDKRYSRVLDMITHESVPRLDNGGVALCHHCQRKVYFAGGFLRLLQNTLENVANEARLREWKKKRATA